MMTEYNLSWYDIGVITENIYMADWITNSVWQIRKSNKTPPTVLQRAVIKVHT